MRARYYNVDIKRFINQDVLTGTITDSPTLNRYSYCEGNPVSLSDPFGLSPRWQATLGSSILNMMLNFTPIVGDIMDIKDGIAYAKEGNYMMAAVCFAALIPFMGDVAGATVKALKGCDRLADVVKFTTKVAANTLVFSYGAQEFGSAAISLINKHVVNGQAWDLDSTLTAIQGVIGGALAWTAGRSIADEIINMDPNMITGSSWCFVEGTLVHTSEGTTPIEEIEPGDYVLAYDEATGESGYQKVVRLFRNTTDELAHVEVVSRKSGESEEIICTPGHKFYVEGEWIAAGELESGDVLTLSDGSKTEVLSVMVEELENPTIIYNFEVENWHNYYVAAEGVLVHNMKCETDGSKLYESSSEFTNDLRKNKPLYSPNIDKWYDSNGTISIDESGIWTYHDWEGNSVSYPGGYPDFKSAGMVKQEVNIGPFQGYNKDFPKGDKMAPNGPISANSTWHHHQDGFTLQEVLTKYHERFRHRGGMSKLKE